MARPIAVVLTLVAVLAPISIPPAAAHQPKRGGVRLVADREDEPTQGRPVRGN